MVDVSNLHFGYCSRCARIYALCLCGLSYERLGMLIHRKKLGRCEQGHCIQITHSTLHLTPVPHNKYCSTCAPTCNLLHSWPVLL